MFGDYSNDLIALGITIVVIAGYQAYLRVLARRDPGAVLWRVAADARALWVETIMAKPADGILAVQTLRNSVTAATFLASTAVLLMVGVLTLSSQAPELKQTWHALNLVGTLNPELWLGKILCMPLRIRSINALSGVSPAPDEHSKSAKMELARANRVEGDGIYR